MRIIAADDEMLVLQLLVDSIAQAVPEADIHGFKKPGEAIEFVRENGCDIAFLDIKMRGMSGLELARRLKDINADINIIFVTGYSEYTLDAFRLYASDYVLKPATPQLVKQAMEHLRTPIKPKTDKKLSIRCFGNFEVFADGKPISFKRAKSKELFAYLVDRMGAACTMGELAAAIWEAGPDNPSRQSNLRNLISDMKRALSEAGAGSVIIKGRNSISLDVNSVNCDYYDFLHHVPYAVNCYRGEYMAQYTWAEITTASLPAQPSR